MSLNRNSDDLDTLNHSSRFSFMNQIDPSRDKQVDSEGPRKVYQWRKYGRKYNKKMGMFCSYFKCMTKESCQARKFVYHKEKKTGTSFREDHHIEIYNEHNHDPPVIIPKRGRKCKMASNVHAEHNDKKNHRDGSKSDVDDLEEDSEETLEVSIGKLGADVCEGVRKVQNMYVKLSSSCHGLHEGISPSTSDSLLRGTKK